MRHAFRGVSGERGRAVEPGKGEFRIFREHPVHKRAKGFERVSLKVAEDEQGRWAVLQVSGEMDLVTSPAVRQHVHDAVADGRRNVVLDLSEVRFCDSSGVGVLIAARRLMRSCQGRLRLILPAQGAVDGSHVNRVLAALGVRRLFEVYPDLHTAVDETAAPLSA